LFIIPPVRAVIRIMLASSSLLAAEMLRIPYYSLTSEM